MCLETSLDADGDILELDERFDILANHLVLADHEDKARFMRTDRLQFLIYSSWKSLI